MWSRAAVNHSHWAVCKEPSKPVNIPVVTDYSCTFPPATIHKIFQFKSLISFKGFIFRNCSLSYFLSVFSSIQNVCLGGGKRQQKSLTSGENFKILFAFWNEIHTLFKKRRVKGSIRKRYSQLICQAHDSVQCFSLKVLWRHMISLKVFFLRMSGQNGLLASE